MLKIANVGDCGLKIIRKGTTHVYFTLPSFFNTSGFSFLYININMISLGQIIFSTSPQEHYFDCPYQLSSERVGQTFLDATV